KASYRSMTRPAPAAPQSPSFPWEGQPRRSCQLVPKPYPRRRAHRISAACVGRNEALELTCPSHLLTDEIGPFLDFGTYIRECAGSALGRLSIRIARTS